jgi:hypothetical protein
VKAKTRTEKYEIIKDMKLKTTIEELVKMNIDNTNSQSGLGAPKYSSENVPVEFVDFMQYCRDLKFDEKPDYTLLRRKFKDLFNRMGYEYDFIYDWNILEKQEKRRQR